jgi:hypothetical protein
MGGDDEAATAVPANDYVAYANTTKTLSQTYQPKWCACMRAHCGAPACISYCMQAGLHACAAS